MPKVFTSQTQKIGELGEQLAVQYLVGLGFRILDRNYTRKWGELDIVAFKNNVVYFYEVKALQKNLALKEGKYDYRPEENVSPSKVLKLRRIIQTYILDKKLGNLEWEFGVIGVFLDMNQRKGRVRVSNNIII